jgi:hypothetical protein
VGPMYLHLHGIVDRLPTEDDVSLLRDISPGSGPRLAASARLMQMALQGNTLNFDAVRALLAHGDPAQNQFMRPLFTWVAWHASQGQDPELAPVRETELSDGDFDLLLAKSLLLALEGDTPTSLRFLRAARYQMSELGLASPNVDRAIPSGYHHALAAWLMFTKTGQDAYRAEALSAAQVQQKVFPFGAWPYALEALIERNVVARTLALCRARFLDADSYFLSQATKDKQAKPVCKTPLWR